MDWWDDVSDIATDLANDALNPSMGGSFWDGLGNEFGDGAFGSTGLGSGGSIWGMESFYFDDEEDPEKREDPVIVTGYPMQGYDPDTFMRLYGWMFQNSLMQDMNPEEILSDEELECGVQTRPDMNEDGIPEGVDSQDLVAAAQQAYSEIRQIIGENKQEVAFGIYQAQDGSLFTREVARGPIGDWNDDELAGAEIRFEDIIDPNAKLVGWIHNQFNDASPSKEDIIAHQNFERVGKHVSKDLVLFVGQAAWWGDSFEPTVYAFTGIDKNTDLENRMEGEKIENPRDGCSNH